MSSETLDTWRQHKWTRLCADRTREDNQVTFSVKSLFCACKQGVRMQTGSEQGVRMQAGSRGPPINFFVPYTKFFFTHTIFVCYFLEFFF